MYKVVKQFKDVDGTIYNVNDSYPAKNVKKPSATRIKTLSTEKNKYGKIYIEKVSE